MIGLMAGVVLIVLGTVPGLFQGLVAGILNFSSLLTSRVPLPAYQYREVRRPKWLTGLGTAMITAVVLAYLSA